LPEQVAIPSSSTVTETVPEIEFWFKFASNYSYLSMQEQTDEARRRGIFGALTFFVGAEMFWGNDRLDDALLFVSDQTLPVHRSIETAP
jgi:2-hydroxychromene-2-carboxylate isomerase